ncbi:hypothetical protein CAL7716_006900 [Calothrix sp. PCC 7716]|nr:hypothetical protein CAL7716_006900 [Calothrix sp. PCC 7716]
MEEYATRKHISVTLAVNLILNDYFCSEPVAKESKQEQIAPTLTQIEPTPKQVVKTVTETPTQSAPATKPRALSLLENLKTQG